MKLWAGSYHNPTDPKTDDFNSSISFDQCMFREDIAGSLAHADMLCGCGILSQADRDAITQVVYNLLDNAIKFCPVGGNLGLILEQDGQKARLRIRNTGQTIPPEELPLLFDRFHKADKARSADREGWGLGLYIAKTIIGAHGGEIWATSENGVTEFSFTLPAVR